MLTALLMERCATSSVFKTTLMFCPDPDLVIVHVQTWPTIPCCSVEPGMSGSVLEQEYFLDPEIFRISVA